MKILIVLFSVLAFTSVVTAGPADTLEAGKKMMSTECVACHSLRLVESQRLSPAAWAKEIDKMVGWGAVVSDKQTLVNYLAEEYSDAKPVPLPEKSGTR